MIITLTILTFVYFLTLLLTGLAIAEGVTYREYRTTRARRQRITTIVNAELKKVA